MRYSVTGGLTACAAATSVFVGSWVSYHYHDLSRGGVGWAPQFDSPAQTAMAYTSASRAITFALSFLVVAALGYRAGRRIDVGAHYRSLIAAFAAGGFVGRLLGVGLVSAFVLGDAATSLGSGPTLELVSVLAAPLATAIHVALVGLAGAALAAFRSDPHTAERLTPSNDAATSESG